MTTNMASGPLRLGRLGAAMGLFFVAATIAGNELANSGDAAGDSTTTALANVRRVHGLTNHLGLMLEIFGFVALMFFAGRPQQRRVHHHRPYHGDVHLRRVSQRVQQPSPAPHSDPDPRIVQT